MAALEKEIRNENINNLDKVVWNYLCNKTEPNLNEVIKAGSRLINYFLRIYSGGGYNEDLRQAGMEGLLKAVKGYNPGKGTSFTTYAGHCIMGEIRHHIRKEASFYQPGCIKDLQYRVENMIEESLKETGEVPSEEYIAERLNVKKESVSEIMKAGMVSLDEINLSRIQNRHYESFALPIEDRIALEQAVKKLSVLQRKVIYLLFFRDMTQEQAAEKLGINQRKVSRLRYRSLNKLRVLMAEA